MGHKKIKFVGISSRSQMQIVMKLSYIFCKVSERDKKSQNFWHIETCIFQSIQWFIVHLRLGFSKRLIKHLLLLSLYIHLWNNARSYIHILHKLRLHKNSTRIGKWKIKKKEERKQKKGLCLIKRIREIFLY